MTETELRNLANIERAAKDIAKQQAKDKQAKYTAVRRKWEEKRERKEFGL